MSSAWNDFEHQVWRNLKEYHLHDRPAYFLAVSGGVDSMALLHLMHRLRPTSELHIVHFHHGDDLKNSMMNDFRQKSLECVQHKISKMKNVKFYFQKSEKFLRSEESLRNARWAFIRSVHSKDSPILTAHHSDDWFETVLLKMIRGTSLEGVQALQYWNSEILRPFLNFSKKEITEYATEQNISWIEDPSNQDSDYLRNWLREIWLKELDQKNPGAVKNFTSSLKKILTSPLGNSTLELVYFSQDEKQGLDRLWFLSLSPHNQLRALANFLKKQEVYDFTQGQLEEIKKRLDKNQKDITFTILRRKWVINATQIMLA